jgi:hypothetical protein
MLIWWFSGLVPSPLDPLVVSLPLCPIFQLYCSLALAMHRYHRYRRRSNYRLHGYSYLPTVSPLFGKISRPREPKSGHAITTLRGYPKHEDKAQDRGNRSVGSALKIVKNPVGTRRGQKPAGIKPPGTQQPEWPVNVPHPLMSIINFLFFYSAGAQGYDESMRSILRGGVVCLNSSCFSEAGSQALQKRLDSGEIAGHPLAFVRVVKVPPRFSNVFRVLHSPRRPNPNQKQHTIVLPPIYQQAHTGQNPPSLSNLSPQSQQPKRRRLGMSPGGLPTYLMPPTIIQLRPTRTQSDTDQTGDIYLDHQRDDADGIIG